MRFALVLLLSLLLPAQVVRVTIENPTHSARTDWVRFTIPDARLPAGALRLGPFVAHRGREIGAGVRMIHARVSMESLESSIWDLVGDSAPPATVESSPASSPPVIRVMVNGGTWDPSIEMMSNGPATDVRLWGRVSNSQLVAELWFMVYPGAEVVPFELLVAASDPRTTDLYASVEDLRMEIDGALAVAPWWPRWRGTQQVSHKSVQLIGSALFGDSQGQAWAGAVALQPTPSAGAGCIAPITAVVARSTWNGHWGPFGVVPDVQLDEIGYANLLRGWFDRSQSFNGDYWRAPQFGLLPNSGSTGGQDDFGSSKLGWAWAGGPTFALAAYQSALHEASRPGLWYEVDGRLVEPWLHPDHITWSGYTHWHRSYSGDRLGKGEQATPRWNGYGGPDREHWSNNTLCGAYLLTGSRLLQRVIEKQARQILSGETLDPRLPSTSGVGASRGIGRTLLAASWIDCCLEPAGELRRRVRERILARIEQKVEPFTRPPAGAVVAPLATIIDPRRLDGVECWSWEEPLGCVGLRAAELRFGSAAARVTLDRALTSWVRYGIWNDGSAWLMAHEVAYLGGAAPAPENYPTILNPAPVFPPQVFRAAGVSFENWGTGALTIAANILTGDDQAKARVALAAWASSTVSSAEWRAAR